ncbi:MAG: ATP-binding protein [Candidatus Dadabacteria bacterium]|nr:ATP-binding protein [Candidatus Dadabacteria bacterium]
MTKQWNFYGRGEELGSLLAHMRRKRWFFGAIRGRRRIGKTALIQQTLKILAEDRTSDIPALLVQLPDSNPSDFTTVFRNAVLEAGLENRVGGAGSIQDLAGIAAAIGPLCMSGVTVVLDEFQICHRGPLRGFPSLLQAQVDRLQSQSPAGGLIVLGSVETEMEALLENRRAPLFGRTTFNMTLAPWSLSTIFKVCERHGALDPARCLTLWTLFGGVPKYWRHFAETDGLDDIPEWPQWTKELCERIFLRSDAPLREEGESLLKRELHLNTLAILRTLAERRKCTHAQLREALPEHTTLGPYLKNLTRDLRLVEKELPVFAGEHSRGARYVVSDLFLSAWLGVIQSACQSARILPISEVSERLIPKLRTLEGHAFERMIRDASEEASRAGEADFPMTDRLRGFWNRPRNGPQTMEIDFIAWNEDNRRVRFGSCKRNSGEHNPKSLRIFRNNVDSFLSTRKGKRFREWQHEFALFSPSFSIEKRRELETANWICRDLNDFRRMLGGEKAGEKGTVEASPKIRGEE